ncbi:MAG: hypothetical protein ABL907_05440, partial [Hyphomicrobium sp.]
HHSPRTPAQDTWAVSFSLPYIATAYAQSGEGVWYVKTWLSAEQIKRRLAILFHERDELLIQELGRECASINGAINWLDGRLEDEEPVSLPMANGPRAAWAAFQAIVEDLTRPLGEAITASRPGNLRAA